jgi:hypothetical protein
VSNVPKRQENARGRSLTHTHLPVCSVACRLARTLAAALLVPVYLALVAPNVSVMMNVTHGQFQSAGISTPQPKMAVL